MTKHILPIVCFCRCKLVSHYKIDDTILYNFLRTVEAGYHPNHYHNNTHAADVLQIMHYIVHKGGMKDVLSMQPNEIFASLISAAIHDFDHPGFNNNFHIKCVLVARFMLPVVFCHCILLIGSCTRLLFSGLDTLQGVPACIFLKRGVPPPEPPPPPWVRPTVGQDFLCLNIESKP